MNSENWGHSVDVCIKLQITNVYIHVLSNSIFLGNGLDIQNPLFSSLQYCTKSHYLKLNDFLFFFQSIKNDFNAAELTLKVVSFPWIIQRENNGNIIYRIDSDIETPAHQCR